MVEPDSQNAKTTSNTDGSDWLVRTWMIRFLPHDARLRDLVVFFVGLFLVRPIEPAVVLAGNANSSFYFSFCRVWTSFFAQYKQRYRALESEAA